MKKYLFLTISLLLTLLVFSFSKASGTESASLSMAIAKQIFEIIMRVFPKATLTIENVHLFLRKTAHIGEYFLLGVFWYLTAIQFQLKMPYWVLLGLLIALIDEGIQLFALDRGPSLIDALVFDFLGYLIGGLFLVFSKKWLFKGR